MIRPVISAGWYRETNPRSRLQSGSNPRERQSACVDHHLQARGTEAYAHAEAACHPFVSSYTLLFFSSVTLLVTIVRAAPSATILVAAGRLENHKGSATNQSPRPKRFLKYNEKPTRDYSQVLPRTHIRGRTWRHRCQFSESGLYRYQPC